MKTSVISAILVLTYASVASAMTYSGVGYSYDCSKAESQATQKAMEACRRARADNQCSLVGEVQFIQPTPHDKCQAIATAIDD